ncbi:unnamed protein product, partial [Iphiclides podalirius]
MSLWLQILVFAVVCSISCKCITIQVDSEDLMKLVDKLMGSEIFRRLALENYKTAVKSEFKNPYHPEDNISNQEAVTLSMSMENDLINERLEKENEKFLANNDKNNHTKLNSDNLHIYQDRRSYTKSSVG